MTLDSLKQVICRKNAVGNGCGKDKIERNAIAPYNKVH